MKIQDMLFIIVIVFFIISRRPRWFVYAGLGSLLAAIPLFAGWVFFTAERLVWYGAFFFLSAVIYQLFIRRAAV